jgi:hypothetical protein
MLRIFRYQLFPDKNGVCKVEMPINASILKLSNNEKREINLHCIVDDSYPCETRTFIILGTGAELEGELSTYIMNYIGSFEKKNLYMFHVFEIVSDSHV